MNARIVRYVLSMMLVVSMSVCVSCSDSANDGGSTQAQDGFNVKESLGTQSSVPPKEPKGPDGPELKTARGYINLSLQHYNQGEWEECIEACIKALNLDPSSAIAYNNIGSAYLQLQDYDRAILACQKAVALDPDFQRAKNNLRAAQRKKADTAP